MGSAPSNRRPSSYGGCHPAGLAAALVCRAMPAVASAKGRRATFGDRGGSRAAVADCHSVLYGRYCLGLRPSPVPATSSPPTPYPCSRSLTMPRPFLLTNTIDIANNTLERRGSVRSVSPPGRSSQNVWSTTSLARVPNGTTVVSMGETHNVWRGKVDDSEAQIVGCERRAA